MSKNCDLRIRIDGSQKERLKNISLALGFGSVSDYVRSKIFEDLTLHSKLNEILSSVKQLKKDIER